MIHATGLKLYDPDNNNTYFAHGYLLGWRNDMSNCKFRKNQDAFIDDFSLFASDPGW